MTPSYVRRLSPLRAPPPPSTFQIWKSRDFSNLVAKPIHQRLFQEYTTCKMVLMEGISAREDNRLLRTNMDINIADTAKTLQRFVKCCQLSPINIKCLLAISKHSHFALPSCSRKKQGLWCTCAK